MIKHKGGFIREDKKDKIDYTLIPLLSLKELAIHYTSGAKVHGVDNWKKSTDVETFKKSAFRHLISVLNEETDEDHISACIWNLMAIKELKNENIF